MEPFIGEIKMFGGNFAPRGYAFCQGQLMSIAQNSALFSLLGTTYGGDGQVTFGLPDMRGRSPVGQALAPGLGPINLGQVGGVENTTLTTNQMPQHTHTVTFGSPLTATGQAAIPAASASTATQAAPAATTVLGPIAAGGRPGTLYSTTAADTTLQPFTITCSGNVPNGTASIAGGSQPFSVRNPYLGINFIIALEGVFPSRN